MSLKRVAAVGCATALPIDGRPQWFMGAFLPSDAGFTLVGNANGINVLNADGTDGGIKALLG